MESGGATAISSLHPDILEAHILTRLDGPTLASASCASSTLYSLSSQDHLWSHICHSTWPSIASSPRLRHLIATFPNTGPRSFFSLSFPLPTSTSPSSSIPNHQTPSELISAVDIHYKNNLIFSEVQETETVTDWFRCSPFRIDFLDPKDVVPTTIPYPEGDDTCTATLSDMTLSWILIEPLGRQAVNLSSFVPVEVHRHWLSGEVQLRYASIFSGDQKGDELVKCEIVVTCGGSEGGEMQVREVSLEVEDVEGMHLNGKESLVILEAALGGGRWKGVQREEEGRRRYREYVEKKRERRERKMRREGALDMLSVAFGVTAFAWFWFFVFWR